MKKILLILLALTLLSAQSAYAIPQPVGVGGQIKINGIGVNGIQVSIKNLNTGETHLTTTKTNQQGNSGFYAIVMDCLEDDILELRVSYNGYVYAKKETVDFSNPTVWLNLSIESTSEPPGDGDGEEPSPDPPGTNNPPIADFTYFPSIIYTKSTVTFRDNSTDLDDDIASWTWTIENNVYTGTIVSYAFQEPGNHTVTLVVTDKTKIMSVKQKKIYVTPLEGEEEIIGENITVYIQVKDKNDKPLANALVEIYRQNDLIQSVYTNSQGIASTIIPQGTYRVQTYHSNEYSYLTHTFYLDDDNLVIYLYTDGDNIIPPASQEEGMNWFMVIGLIVGISIVLFLIVGRWRRWI